MFSKNLISRSFSAAPQNAVKATVANLKNGAKVATEATGGNVSSVSVFVTAGSRHDAAHGSARLLQRLATKGTKKRNAEQIRGEIASLGGHFQTDIGREHTRYTVTVLNKDVARAVELLGDIVANPNLDDKAVNDEKALHAQEGRDINTEMFEHLHETAFHDTPLGRTVSGAENALNLSKNDVQSFFTNHYTGNRVAIGATGGVEHNQVAELAEKHFGGLAVGGKLPAVAPAVFVGSDKRVRYDSMDKAHVFLAYKNAGRDSSAVYTSLVAQQLLGSWNRLGQIQLDSASRLARELAEHKAVHSFSTFNRFYSDTGLFGIQFVASDNNLENAMYNITYNLVRLVHNVVDEEVERAKAQLLTNFLSNQENPDTASVAIARQLAHYDRRISREESVARISAITTDDIKAWANNVVHDEDHALAAKGPIFELPDYNWIRRRSYWHRY